MKHRQHRQGGKLRIHCLQHVEFKGQAFLPFWAHGQGHRWTRSLVPEASELPPPTEFDALIIVGGPMSVSEERQRPWLTEEKRFIERVLGKEIPTLGICLGAQLIAEVLGARVYPGAHREIGWHQLRTCHDIATTWLRDTLPEAFDAFFWHGETFDLPSGATRIASSNAYLNQGFVHGQALGLQFHLEVTQDWVQMLVNRDAAELLPGAHIQDAATVLAKPKHAYEQCNTLMAAVLDRWLNRESREQEERERRLHRQRY